MSFNPFIRSTGGPEPLFSQLSSRLPASKQIGPPRIRPKPPELLQPESHDTAFCHLPGSANSALQLLLRSQF